jgi:hypothetical protein
VPAELHAELNGVLTTISRGVVHEIGAGIRDIEGAQKFVLALQQNNQLKEPVLCDLANKCELEKLTAALALMTNTKLELVDRLMRAIHCGGLIIACKAADLKWATVDIILRHRLPKHPIAAHELDQAKADFGKLTRPTAIRLLGFWQAQPGLLPH